MDRYISITVKPPSGSPYEKLVNVSSVTIKDDEGESTLLVPQNMYDPLEWNFSARQTTGGPASTADVCGWMSRALVAFNGVSGPVQKALDSPKFYFRNFSYAS